MNIFRESSLGFEFYIRISKQYKILYLGVLLPWYIFRITTIDFEGFKGLWYLQLQNSNHNDYSPKNILFKAFFLCYE